MYLPRRTIVTLSELQALSEVLPLRSDPHELTSQTQSLTPPPKRRPRWSMRQAGEEVAHSCSFMGVVRYYLFRMMKGHCLEHFAD